jgi:hypothetical protein
MKRWKRHPAHQDLILTLFEDIVSLTGHIILQVLRVRLEGALNVFEIRLYLQNII